MNTYYLTLPYLTHIRVVCVYLLPACMCACRLFIIYFFHSYETVYFILIKRPILVCGCIMCSSTSGEGWWWCTGGVQVV